MEGGEGGEHRGQVREKLGMRKGRKGREGRESEGRGR